jgi:hypothetical protein
MPVPGGTTLKLSNAFWLAVALHLDVDVLAEGFVVAEPVDHHRVVDDQVHGRQRVDALRVATGLGHGSAHGREVDHGGHAGKVLHQYARRAVLDFSSGFAFGQPVGDGLEVVTGYRAVVFPTQQVFQQHLERHRQFVEIAQRARGIREAEVVVGFVVDVECLEAFQAIEGGHD